MGSRIDAIRLAASQGKGGFDLHDILRRKHDAITPPEQAPASQFNPLSPIEILAETDFFASFDPCYDIGNSAHSSPDRFGLNVVQESCPHSYLLARTFDSQHNATV
jgi:hypothetical protein